MADPVGGTHPHQSGGELIQIGLAHRNGPGLDKALHHEGMLVRFIAVVGTGRRGGQTRQIDIVLDGEGYAVERMALRRGPLQSGQVALQRLPIETADPDGIVTGRFDAGHHLIHHL